MEAEYLGNQGINNPLDTLEKIISLKHWSYSRENEDELIIDIDSKISAYRLYIAWSKDTNVMGITITFDVKVPFSKINKIYELLALINENLFIGHFDITSKSGIPAYRNTYLIRDKNIENIKILEDLVDIGIIECERFYHSFQMVIWENYIPTDAVYACLFETKGRA
tara:strand:- start:175 stop:675 length:501 start_codon:yes stop_codon:yes gene_type:complete